MKIHFVIPLLLSVVGAAGAFTDLQGNWKGVWDIDGTTAAPGFILKSPEQATALP